MKKEGFLTKLIDEAIDEYQLNEGTNQMTQIYKDLDKKFPKFNHTKISDFNKISKYLKTKFSKGSGLPDTIASFYDDYKGGEDMKKNINRLTKYDKKMKGYAKESVNEAKFSKDQIEIMRHAYGTLSRMNPSSPTYKKFIKFLDKLPKDQLKQLANAKIKFVSILAKNRIKGESVKESDLGLTYKKGKTVKVKHKTSGKSLVIIDKPNVRKEYEKIGFYAESVNEGEKRDSNQLISNFSRTFQNFTREVNDLAKGMTKITGYKTDEKIIMKNFKKQVIPFINLIDSWNKRQQKNPHIDEKVIKVSKKDDVPGNAMKMSGEEKIKKLTYSGSNGKGSYEIKGKNLNVIGIRPRDKGFFVRHFTMKTGFRKANLYYDGVSWMDKNKKF